MNKIGVVKLKRRNDIILITILLAGIIFLFVYLFIIRNSSDTPYVNIYHEDKILYSVPLSKNDEIIVKGDISEMTIIIKNGHVHVEKSGCDNQICVNEGEKGNYNEMITCLPNKIYIRIGSKQDVNS